MSLELVFTSAPRGLRPNSSGLCTVAMTAGMSRQVRTKLEPLSGYDFHFSLSDPNARLNPTNYAHTRLAVGGRPLSILSRVAFAGADYSGRTNMIGHHFALADQELLPGGPAWMASQMAQRVFLSEWSDAPKELPPRSLDQLLASCPDTPPGPAEHWGKLTDDPGWAGVLAAAFRAASDSISFVIYKPGTDLLPLFEESLAILPPAERWGVGFATYFTSAQSGCHYAWRGVVAGSKAATSASRFVNAAIIDLTRPLGRAVDNPYTEAARQGHVVEAAPQAAAPTARRPSGRAAASGSDLLEPTPTVPLPALTYKDTGFGAATAYSSPLLSGAARAGRRAPDTTVPSHWRTLALVLAAVAAVLAITCVVTRRGSQVGSTSPEGRSEELFEVKTKLNATEAKLRAAEAKVKNAETAKQELQRRADAAAEEADGAKTGLAAKDRELVSIKSVLQKANDKIEWLKSRYYATQGAKIHPSDLKHEPTPDHTARVTKPEATGGAMRLALLNLTDVSTVGGFPKRRVLPSKDDPETGTASYPSKRCDGFLAAPDALTKILKIEQTDGKTLVVRHKGKGPMKIELLRCTLDPKAGLIMRAKDKKTAREYAQSIRFLVLEAASLAGKVVHQYQRECPTDEKKMQLIYSADGTAPQAETGFEYPWPEALAVQYGDLNEGKPFPLFPEARRFAGNTRKPSMSTKRAETTASADADKSHRTIVLKRDVPDVTGRPLRLELGLDLPKGTGPRGVKVTLSARVLADYCGAIDAKEAKAKEPWRAPLRKLAELKAAEQKPFKELQGLHEERNGLAKSLEARKKERADAEKNRDHLTSLKKELDDRRKWVRRVDKELSMRPGNRPSKKGDGALQDDKTKYILEGRAIQKRIRSCEKKAQEDAKNPGRVQRAIEEIEGRINGKKREIEAKGLEHDKKRKEWARERNRLKALPEGLFRDVGSVKILDPWGRTLWVITPRLVRGKP